MTWNRFQSLLRAWHFADNAADQGSNRLHKIDGFVELLIRKFVSAKIPGQAVVTDESMVPFRGRLKFRQYLPMKAHKYGIKLFKLCDAQGYTYNIKIYAGKQDEVERDLGSKTVMNLLCGYLDEGRTLYTDNFYTNVDLAKTC